MEWLRTQWRALRMFLRDVDDEDTFTVLLVPDSPAQPLDRYQLRAGKLRKIVARATVGVVALCFVVVLLMVLVLQRGNPVSLRKENSLLALQVAEHRTALDVVSNEIDRVRDFEESVRALTLQDHSMRDFGVTALDIDGPVTEEDRGPDDGIEPTEKADLLVARANAAEARLAELAGYLQDRSSVLRSYPSLLPVEGWITSGFGFRLNPWSGSRKLHAGLDVAAPHGTPVIAPADGFVTLSSYGSGYGNEILVDHGYGLVTRYAHLSQRLVRVGDHVLRGQLIGKVGSTGHSTGPHLHYEVIRDGVRVNPRSYILP